MYVSAIKTKIYVGDSATVIDMKSWQSWMKSISYGHTARWSHSPNTGNMITT